MISKHPSRGFGGKSRAASRIWKRFGNVTSYVEPFAGSLAVLLNRPTPFRGVETVNDADGFICNVWRAIQADPGAVAQWASWPVSECDLTARHAWLVERRATLTARLEGDPDYFDPKIAGWWLWGIACWIGSGWCSGKGPWRAVETEDGSRQLVHLGSNGQGVNRQRVHLGDNGRGVNRKLVHLGTNGRGVNRTTNNSIGGLYAYMKALSDRLRYVRVCCGDWTRVLGESPLLAGSRRHSDPRAAILLDPPYASETGRDADLYAVDDGQIAHAVREWAIAHGDNPRYRICLCGYDGEHVLPPEWECIEGQSGQGYGYGIPKRGEGGYANARRERLWFSKYCCKPDMNQSVFSFA